MTALKYIASSAVLRRGPQKLLLHRHVDNDVDMSEQFKGYTWCKVQISRDKDCFAGRTGERDNNIVVG